MISGRVRKLKKVDEKTQVKKKPKEDKISIDIDDSEMDFGEGDFSPIEEQSPMQILNAMLLPENVEMHTEIPQPLNLTRLETLAKWCGDEKAFDSQNSINYFVNKFRINMVSFDRRRAKEVIQALTESIKEERRLSEKLMTPSKGENI